MTWYKLSIEQTCISYNSEFLCAFLPEIDQLDLEKKAVNRRRSVTWFNTWSEKPTWLNLWRVRLKRWSIRKFWKLSIDDTQHGWKTSHTFLFTSWFNTCLKIIPENVIPGIPLFTSLCIDQEVRSFKLSIFTSNSFSLSELLRCCSDMFYTINSTNQICRFLCNHDRWSVCISRWYIAHDGSVGYS